MSDLHVSPSQKLAGRLTVPGDKSISHRSLLLGALANGTSSVNGFLPGGDCMATLTCIQQLGIETYLSNPDHVRIHGKGLYGLTAPVEVLNCIRSGTTIRLLAGILAAQPFESTLSGDTQLLRRPMERISLPLIRMGAEINSDKGHAPLNIKGKSLHGEIHHLGVASAQVKSALLLAGLYASGVTSIQSPGPSRDHTERMLVAMGTEITIQNLTVNIKTTEKLQPIAMQIPGDFSSAAFIIIAALLVPGSEIIIENIGVNTTRTGLLDVLDSMGTHIPVQNTHQEGNEPVADLFIQGGHLQGTRIAGDTVVRMIDEFPLLAVAATQAHGRTTVEDAHELRVKETDRIATVVEELAKLGAPIEATPNGFTMEGPVKLQGGMVDSHGDHRLAMALAVAGLVAGDEVIIQNADCISDSFPGFVRLMQSLGAKYG